MFLFFSVARSPDIGQGDRANEALQVVSEGDEPMPTDKLLDVSPLALRMSSPVNANKRTTRPNESLRHGAIILCLQYWLSAISLLLWL